MVPAARVTDGRSRLLETSCWLIVSVCGAWLLLQMARHGAGSVMETSSACLFRRVAGVPCPGCGLSRALVALLHGDWRSVGRLHPMAPLLALQGMAVWAIGGAWATGRLSFPQSRLERFAERLILTNAALLVLLWGGRVYLDALPW